MALATNKVRFKTNKPIMLPVQTKTWGYHEAVPMDYNEVFKLLSGGAEDVTMVSDDGTETPITWENLETYFPKEDLGEDVHVPTTLEGDFFVGYDEDILGGDFGPSFDLIDGPVTIPDGPTVNVPIDQFVDKESGEVFAPGMVETTVPPMGEIPGDGIQVEEPGDVDAEAPFPDFGTETDNNEYLGEEEAADDSTAVEGEYVEEEDLTDENAPAGVDEDIATADEVL